MAVVDVVTVEAVMAATAVVATATVASVVAVEAAMAATAVVTTATVAAAVARKEKEQIYS